MADYAIGDIQGCYDPLLRLLDTIDFDDKKDRLWLVGDLVNRGPHSLKVIRFIKNLAIPAQITLGNHDLHLLSRIFTNNPPKNHDDTLQPILDAADREDIGHWLRKQSILITDDTLNIAMCHAGIAPMWDMLTAKKCAQQLEDTLRGSHFIHFLENMYGNFPNQWDDALSEFERLRLICNYFTRMRFCTKNGALAFDYKGQVENAPNNLYPWFLVPDRVPISMDIVFGHWAALQGKSGVSHIHAIDSGCYWGNHLTALRLEDKKRFMVACS